MISVSDDNQRDVRKVERTPPDEERTPSTPHALMLGAMPKPLWDSGADGARRSNQAAVGGSGPSLSSSGPALSARSLRGEDTHIPPDGALIGGIYRVIRRLGEGAMGVILLAQDEHLQRQVAIKLLHPEQADIMQGRLLEEARAMARVHHPNVVEVFACGEHGGDRADALDARPVPYFVMQYVEGETLDSYTRRRGGAPLALDEALCILDQICLGVGAIHASGVVHRDLKPSNILIDPDLHVSVADLGLARRLAGDEHTPISYSGTPAYVAPEIVTHHRLDPALLSRVDVYALGLIAYWLLVGRFPFNGKSVLELFRQHVHTSPARPSDLRPDLPASFDAPLLAALAKDPAERTESAEAFCEALFAAREEARLSDPSMRVMIADGDAAFRSFLSDALKAALPGAHIEAVADGDAALAAIKRSPPALGVFDLDVPGLDGIALTAAVRALPRGGDFPILVAIGAGGAADWQRLSRLGASAFLVKPFDAGQLIPLTRGLVGLSTQGPPSSVPSSRGARRSVRP